MKTPNTDKAPELADLIESLTDGRVLANQAVEMFGEEFGRTDVALVYALALRLAFRAKDQADLNDGLARTMRLLTSSSSTFLKLGKDNVLMTGKVAGHG